MMEYVNEVIIPNPVDGEPVSYAEIVGLDAYVEWLTVMDGDDAFVAKLALHTDPDRWDHLSPRRGFPVLAHAVSKLKFADTPISPAMALGEAMGEYRNSLFNHVMDGNRVLVNKVGGWQILHAKDEHKVIERKPYDIRNRRLEPLHHGEPKVVCLENDPKPEKHAIERMRKEWDGYVVILCLREYDTHELEQTLSDLNAKGVNDVYVYTTGGDVPQMYEYLDALVAAGMRRLFMEFTGNSREEHVDFCDAARGKGVEVECIFSDEI